MIHIWILLFIIEQGTTLAVSASPNHPNDHDNCAQSCPHGWMKISLGCILLDKHYCLSGHKAKYKQGCNWFQAELECERLNASLVVIDDESKNKEILKLTSKEKHVYWWMGSRLSDLEEPLPFHPWCSDDPHPFLECIRILDNPSKKNQETKRGCWENVSCHNLGQPLCIKKLCKDASKQSTPQDGNEPTTKSNKGLVDNKSNSETECSSRDEETNNSDCQTPSPKVNNDDGQFFAYDHGEEITPKGHPDEISTTPHPSKTAEDQNSSQESESEIAVDSVEDFLNNKLVTKGPDEPSLVTVNSPIEVHVFHASTRNPFYSTLITKRYVIHGLSTVSPAMDSTAFNDLNSPPSSHSDIQSQLSTTDGVSDLHKSHTPSSSFKLAPFKRTRLPLVSIHHARTGSKPPSSEGSLSLKESEKRHQEEELLISNLTQSSIFPANPSSTTSPPDNFISTESNPMTTSGAPEFKRKSLIHFVDYSKESLDDVVSDNPSGTEAEVHKNGCLGSDRRFYSVGQFLWIQCNQIKCTCDPQRRPPCQLRPASYKRCKRGCYVQGKHYGRNDVYRTKCFICSCTCNPNQESLPCRFKEEHCTKTCSNASQKELLEAFLF